MSERTFLIDRPAYRFEGQAPTYRRESLPPGIAPETQETPVKQGKTRLSPEVVNLVRAYLKAGHTTGQIATMLQMSPAHVSNIRKSRSYTEIPYTEPDEPIPPPPKRYRDTRADAKQPKEKPCKESPNKEKQPKEKQCKPRIRRLSDEQVIEIRRRLAAGESQSHAARATGISQAIISSIHRGRAYKDITLDAVKEST